MRRRRFLELSGKATVAMGITPTCTVACSAESSSNPPKNWTWVHGGEPVARPEWERRFQQLRSGGIDGVLVGGGNTSLLSSAAHDHGLEFHRWTWTLNRNSDPWVKEHHPEWFTVSRNGESSLDSPPYVDYYQWLCPTRSGVRDYLAGVVDEIARDPAVDGVHLDYIRHADVILPVGLWEKYDLVQDREYPEFDFCYCDVCRQAFRDQTGTDPLALPDPSASRAWREFRWDSVTQLVHILTDTVHAHGKPVSAAVFPTPTLARKLVRQAWDEWPLDAFFPMLYHGFYEEPVTWIGDATRAGVLALPSRVPLYSGLYLPDLSPDELARAVTVALEAGAAGVSLFESGGLSPSHLARLGTVLRS